MHGHPITAKLPEDLGIGERFWYWHGASGQSYIHSIYAADGCPPLPGAVFVAVRRREGLREPVAVGRFSGRWDGSAFGLAGNEVRGLAVDELHVHLLARGDAAAASVFEDLQRALTGALAESGHHSGFSEPSLGELALA